MQQAAETSSFDQPDDLLDHSLLEEGSKLFSFRAFSTQGLPKRECDILDAIVYGQLPSSVASYFGLSQDELHKVIQVSLEKTSIRVSHLFGIMDWVERRDDAGSETTFLKLKRLRFLALSAEVGGDQNFFVGQFTSAAKAFLTSKLAYDAIFQVETENWEVLHSGAVSLTKFGRMLHFLEADFLAARTLKLAELVLDQLESKQHAYSSSAAQHVQQIRRILRKTQFTNRTEKAILDSDREIGNLLFSEGSPRSLLVLGHYTQSIMYAGLGVVLLRQASEVDDAQHFLNISGGLYSILLKLVLEESEANRKADETFSAERWITNRKPNENPDQFIRRVYADRIGKLTRLELKTLDPELYDYLGDWLLKKKNNLSFYLPTKEQSISEELGTTNQSADEIRERLKTVEREASALRRRLKKLQPT